MDTPLNPAILYVLIFVRYYVCVVVCLYLHIWLRNILVSNYYHGNNILGIRQPECPMTHLLMRKANFLLTHVAGPCFTFENVHITVGCKTHLKIRDIGRGTTTFAKEGIDLTRVTHLLSRCGITAVYACQLILKKLRGGDCNGGIYRALCGVSQNKPMGYEVTSWTKTLEA
jgi:hypothetical protein